MKCSHALCLLAAGLVASFSNTALAQLRDRPDDPVRDAVADDIRRESWRREMRRLEFEEQQTRRWASAMEADLRAAESRLEDQIRMNKVLLQQYQVAGEEEKAEQVEAKVKDQVNDLQTRRRAFQEELEERMNDLRERRERLQAEFNGEAPPAPDRPATRGQHMQAAVQHLAEAAEHLEAAGMGRQAEQLLDQLREVERELRNGPPDRPRERAQNDPRELIETIERLHERMERMEEKLERLNGRD